VSKTARKRTIAVVTPTDTVVEEVRSAFSRLWPSVHCDIRPMPALYERVVDRRDPDRTVTVRRINAEFQASATAGADAIVFAGSVFGDYVREARAGLTIPVLTSFEAMVEQALEAASPLLAVSTAERSLVDLTDQMRVSAAQQGQALSLKGIAVPAAFEALYKRRDRRTHDDLVRAAIMQQADGEVICLAQFSMRPVRVLLPAQWRVLDPITSAIWKLRSLLQDHPTQSDQENPPCH
jgi:Asp/Glu/hydantoin racemase